MDTIIVINDHSEEARHAAELAFNIAGKLTANLLVINVVQIIDHIVSEIKVAANHSNNIINAPEPTLIDHLRLLHNPGADFIPELINVDTFHLSAKAVARIINKNNIRMIVKGTSQIDESNTNKLPVNIQAVLNQVSCPLLLVPHSYKLRDFERMVYIADLRYCSMDTVKFLAELAKPYNAGILIAHITAKGLPEIEENYARNIFKEGISANVNYNNLMFANVTNNDLQQAVDVMINIMHTDLLALINHQFHLKKILGRRIPHTLPQHITTPLLIFPY